MFCIPLCPQTWKVFCAKPLPDSVKTILFASLMYVSQQLDINFLILLMHFMDLQYLHWKLEWGKIKCHLACTYSYTHAHTHSRLHIPLVTGIVSDLVAPNHQRLKERGQSSKVSASKTVRVEAVTQEQEEPLQSLPWCSCSGPAHSLPPQNALHHLFIYLFHSH